MPHLQDSLLIASDLDGTLLDHHTYRWEAASGWLGLFKQRDVPVVLCSSKSAAEMIEWQKELGLSGQPFIAENGAVIQLPESWQDHENAPRILVGVRHEELIAMLDNLRRQSGFKFICFADVDDNTVSEWTGLTRKQASLARLREASEAFIWRDSEEMFRAFAAQIADLGLTLVQGGRFWHVVDKQSDIGQALRWLLQEYQQRDGVTYTSIGLGDGPNDTTLLDNVDYAVVVKGYSRQPIVLRNDNPERVYHSLHYGPEGWKEGLDHFIPTEA
ncbi:mannosyl-3-phosphoglycerate phosphatase-related protein [Enterobacteriaceae bacterium H11S18]|uniref:mannosyl-3-phosphoglycerate phosphatase-related protein n=1 Tax=Dryocola clanedunensis TaxID=2925396 RepID=UPI0022F10214|nr:mannosyl-3-phosphoglycerate phosphatase-related protein [Dryocola clanedunensis]MCT4712185.1 mannosyl-3-phosphoglycerate phosphatase-related protein [Dryocola clanedunensis]